MLVECVPNFSEGRDREVIQAIENAALAVRGVAVLAGMVFHLWGKQVGFLATAVDLFFVLSGYLITSIILREGRKPGFLLTFYVRRGLRIWPIYYLALLAYVEMLERDVARLGDCRKRINVMPLGSGALAGSTIILDREFVARELGFDSVSQNSMDAVSDRDFIAELLFAISLLGVHLSRLSEDVILWASAEFAFVTLSDAHTTGSSLMPQKKNPDVAELTRGKSARLIGNLTSILTLLKGLPMTYNRDLQEDKEPLFDSVDTIALALEVFTEMIGGMDVNRAKTAAAAGDPLLLATDLADYLVKRGVPFRQAHEVIGKLVAHCGQTGCSFSELKLEDYRKFSDAFADDVFAALKLDTALAARQGIGAPSPANVKSRLEHWRQALSAS